MGLEMRPAKHRQLLTKLQQSIEGDVLFDRASRGRYSTDASIYQIQPIGVVVPKTESDVLSAVNVALEKESPSCLGAPAPPQCGQTVGEALVIDFSRHLTQIVDYNREQRVITVQAGLVLDDLNAHLKPDGLHFSG